MSGVLKRQYFIAFSIREMHHKLIRSAINISRSVCIRCIHQPFHLSEHLQNLCPFKPYSVYLWIASFLWGRVFMPEITWTGVGIVGSDKQLAHQHELSQIMRKQ